MNKLTASLYVVQFSPIDDFRAVYNGSRSMRGGWLLDFALTLTLRDFEDITGVEELIDPGAGLLNAAGSISTILCARLKGTLYSALDGSIMVS